MSWAILYCRGPFNIVLCLLILLCAIFFCLRSLYIVLCLLLLLCAILYCLGSSYLPLYYPVLLFAISYFPMPFYVSLCNCSLFCDIIIVAALNKAVLDMAITFQNYCFTSYIAFLAQFY